MPKRKFEFYKLTISGLVDETDYRELIYDAWRSKSNDLPALQWQHGDKTHALRAAAIDRERRLRLRFCSFKTGYRPDVIDVEDGHIEPNPMSDTQTGVDYTHVLLDSIRDKWIAMLEKTQPGLHPNGLALYINWLLDNFVPEDDGRVADSIVVSLEPEVDSTFIARINSLARVVSATIRIVQPNPGWADLDTDISAEAAASQAAKADVTMTAKRGESLLKGAGIVGQIKKEQQKRTLGFARIEGFKEDGNPDNFTSVQMVEKAFSNVPIDENGQVLPEATFVRMSGILDQKE
jgi:hypothetical protein